MVDVLELWRQKACVYSSAVGCALWLVKVVIVRQPVHRTRQGVFKNKPNGGKREATPVALSQMALM